MFKIILSLIIIMTLLFIYCCMKLSGEISEQEEQDSSYDDPIKKELL